MLSDGFHDIPAGKVAAVVTHLEMREPAARRSVPAPEGLTFERIEQADPAWYRDLYRRVGSQDWLWFSRLGMEDRALAETLHDPDVELNALMQDGVAQGIVELDFRTARTCELAFFGLTSGMIGRGAGRFMMNHAITRAWSRPIDLFHLHTCTLDSPGALAFYRRSGFDPVRQQIEIADDPRLSGLLPQDAGAHVPMFPTG